MTQYQNYKKYKLPITLNPLEYGKLLLKLDNIYIISVTAKAVAIITKFNEINEIKFFREGDLIFSYKDYKIDDNQFIRTLNNNKFIFKDNILIEKTIILVVIIINSTTLLKQFLYRTMNNIISILNIFIENNKAELFILMELILIILIYIIFFVIFPENKIDITISMSIIRTRHVWINESYSFENKIFTSQLFQTIYNKFLKTLKDKFTDSNHIYILLKIKYRGNQTLSIGTVQRFNKIDKQWYFDYIINNIEFKTEFYKEQPIDSIIFSYGFKEGLVENKNLINQDLTYHDSYNYKIPISMNPLDYGTILWENDNKYTIQNEEGLIIKFNKFEGFNEIEFFRNRKLIVKFTDKFISENSFERRIGSKIYLFENRTQVLFKQELETKFISKLTPVKSITQNIICMDIETYMDGDTMIPFLICYYDGINSYYFGLWDYPNVESMILDCLSSILTRKYNGYKIYFHNMAKFDIIFLLKYLVKLVEVKPIIHNGKIIQIDINYGPNNQYKLTFKDSYLILLRSLNELSQAFKVDNPKGLFPFLFVNKDNLNYIGNIPEFETFGDKISKDQYLEYSKQFSNDWNLKVESIDYCILDCISLYQILNKFSELIFNLFQVNIHKYPTLSSIAFAIFRTNFLKEGLIPKLNGKIAENIRKSYTGGSVDMYIPSNMEGKIVKGYDVNSLYPSQMSEYEMPIGKPTYFEGDITKFNENAFGFFYCKIKTPDNLLHPIIQTRVKSNEGIRTIAPLGSWSDWLFSNEMENALMYGYSFEIEKGYIFESQNIFKDYVETLFSMRQTYKSSDVRNYIAKILLNSLYGRFGMSVNFDKIKILHKDLVGNFEFQNFESITDEIDLGDYVLIFYKDKNEDEELDQNVSVGIASAITAYARIHMSKFKNNSDIILYYTDTDSIYTESNIDSSLINSKTLGKLKLENTCKRVIFLAPKLYYLETIDNKIIYKVKGLKKDIELTLTDFENLLYKDVFITKHQTKWFRSLEMGKIDILDSIYTIKVTDNKRKLIYNENNKLVSTLPYIINENKEILNN